MCERLGRAFAEVHAEDELKQRTIEAVFPRARRHRRYPLALAAACLVILLSLGGGVFFTPVSAIGIEINPSLELKINRFDIVIGVEGLNGDGKRIAENTQLMFTEYSQAIDTLIAAPQIQTCLDQGKELSIFVLCDDEQRCGRMLEKVEGCVGSGNNVTCHAGGNCHGHGYCGGSGGVERSPEGSESSTQSSESSTQSSEGSQDQAGQGHQNRHQNRHRGHHSE